MRKLLLFFIVIILDRLSKFLALRYLLEGSIEVFPSLNLELTFNRGISFGLFQGASITLYFGIFLLTVLVIYGWVVYSMNEHKSGKSIIPHTLIFAGAISNLMDRFLYMGVVDFIDCYIGSYHWPTFNIADVFIVVSIFFIIVKDFGDVHSKAN